MHRVGQHGVKEGPDRRRCLTIDEMEAKGMRLGKLGYWTQGRDLSYLKDKTPSHTRNAHNR